jgi:hypothetical protein
MDVGPPIERWESNTSRLALCLPFYLGDDCMLIWKDGQERIGHAEKDFNLGSYYFGFSYSS